MIRLTLILALAIFAVLVLAPGQEDAARDGPSQSDQPVVPASATGADPDPGASDALREGPDGQLVLVTTTGEELSIDLVVEPSDLAAGDARADRPSAGTSDAPETVTVDAAAERPEPPATERQTGAPRLRVTGDRVNFRAGPSTDDEILAALTLGTEVELIERVGDGWAHLRVPATGLTGYMSGDFLGPAN